MKIKIIISIFLLIYQASSHSSCNLDPEFNKLVPDKEIRAVDEWLKRNAPKKLQLLNGKKNMSIPLNWDGFIYHLVTPEITCPPKAKNCALCKITGFHHDPQGKIQDSGIINFSNIIQDDKTEIYRATIEYRGLIKDSTFFPQKWSIQTVAQKLLEVIRSAKLVKYDENVTEIQGTTSEGIIVRILIQYDNKVGTAFPVMP